MTLQTSSPIEREIVTYRVLPALVGGPVVGVVLGDIAVDPGQSQLFVWGGGDGLHDQLRVAVGRLRVVARVAHVAHVAHVARAVARLGG